MLKLLFTATEGSPSHDPAPAPTAAAAAAVGTPTTAALECPICLQTCIHPARLPCGHIFCFLCVKVRMSTPEAFAANIRIHMASSSYSIHKYGKACARSKLKAIRSW